MSTFYLLPSRPLVGERFASYLDTVLPGLEWSNVQWSALAETLAALIASRPEVYVVYREELSDDDPATALCDGFGATTGDEIVEVVPGAPPKRWRLGADGRKGA